MNKKLKISYCGIEGAWANIAAKKVFPESSLIAFSSFLDAYNAVEHGDCDYAVLPVENSYAGDVGGVFDLMHNGSLVVVNTYNLHISQALLGVKGAKIEDIKTVISHQQAIEQCLEFIQEHNLTALPSSNTAVAAKKVSDKNDKSFAAIASEESASLYGLEVLKKSINVNQENCTKFAIFTKNHEKQKQMISPISILMFSVKNIPGALAKAVKIIGDEGFNLLNIKSRPVKNIPWKYYFYIEVEGNLLSNEGKELLEKLSLVCEDEKIAGTYEKS